MASSPILGISLFLTLAATLLLSPVLSQTCKTQSFTNNAVFSNCLDLPTLTSYLHYSYDKANSSLSVAFAAAPPKPDGWVAWAVNPTGEGMAGAQSLIAFKGSDGSVTAKTFAISSYSSVVESKLSFEVWDLSAESSNGVMRIFAKVKVPANAVSVNHVWQVGPSVAGGVPSRHDFQPPNLNAKGKLSLTGATATTTTSTASSVDSRTKRKNIHGILNAVSWGILFPVGAMVARYVRTFESADPGWFYVHIFCQMSGYAIGVAGWATGLKLGGESVGIQYTNHRNIGIALFTLATVQIFALFLRPKKDHKFRFYWNVYHHGVGYAILALGIFNVFKGLNILNPEKQWKSAYLITIVTLGAVSLLLEAITWVVVLRKKSNKSTKPYDGFGNGQGTERPLSM